MVGAGAARLRTSLFNGEDMKGPGTSIGPKFEASAGLVIDDFMTVAKVPAGPRPAEGHSLSSILGNDIAALSVTGGGGIDAVG